MWATGMGTVTVNGTIADIGLNFGHGFENY